MSVSCRTGGLSGSRASSPDYWLISVTRQSRRESRSAAIAAVAGFVHNRPDCWPVVAAVGQARPMRGSHPGRRDLGTPRTCSGRFSARTASVLLCACIRPAGWALPVPSVPPVGRSSLTPSVGRVALAPAQERAARPPAALRSRDAGRTDRVIDLRHPRNGICGLDRMGQRFALEDDRGNALAGIARPCGCR